MVRYIYDAWGNHISTVLDETYAELAELNPFRYRSYYYDKETKLYYLQTRYYDPETGRFISQDGIEYADPEKINCINLYAYCGYNPVMYVDPTGHNAVLQFFVSLFCYIGMAVASIWDKDIRADMNAIGWNPFNTNELLVINSNKVSFYKGVPVFKSTSNRSGTFFVVVLDAYANETTLRHEYGHIIQQLIMGPISYALMIGLPSWREWSLKPYYERPWEITADIFGGVSTRKHVQVDINRGFWYLAISSVFGPFGYLFLIGEY